MFKVCKKCGKEFLATSEFFSKSPDNKDGLLGSCKECLSLYSKRRWLAITQSDEYELFREKQNELHREYNKRHYQKNRESILEYKRNYYMSNLEKMRSISKKTREKNKETRKMRAKKHRDTIKDKIRVYKQGRHSLKHQLPSTLTLTQWEDTKQYFNNECCYCGQTLPLTQDHFIPLNHGGGYTKENIIPACRACNCSKSDRDFIKWYYSRDYYSIDRELKILTYLSLT